MLLLASLVSVKFSAQATQQTQEIKLKCLCFNNRDHSLRISPLTHWGLPCWFPACRSSFWVSHSTSCCVRLSLISSWPIVHTHSCSCARPHCTHCYCCTCFATESVHHSRSLNSLTAREPNGLSSRSWLLLLSSYHMVLPSECKNPSQFAWEIEIFTICLITPHVDLEA